MSNLKKDISVVVFANRTDFFLTKLCIASIRYYYPDVNIYLVKDYLNGNFATKYFREAYDVKLVKMDRRYFGWAASKLHFLVNDQMPEGRYLTLDSDITFIGNVLDALGKNDEDFVVSGEVYPEPLSDLVKKVFINPEKMQKVYEEYRYPGFFFNAGQVVVRPGIIDKSIFKNCFNFNKFPFYTNPENFTFGDQSILNTILPILRDRNQLTIKSQSFMVHSKEFFKKEENKDMSRFMDGNVLPFVIHFAGEKRIPDVSKLNGTEILTFFYKNYQKKLGSFKSMLSGAQDSLYSVRYINRFLYLKNKALVVYFSLK